MKLLTVEGVGASYGPVQALHDVNLTLDAGRVCGLIGMNGSGKSTLFKTLMGIHPNARGRVLIEGRTPQQARAEGIVSYVPQSEDIDTSFPVSVQDVVSMGTYRRLGPTRRPTAEARAAVAAALERVELADLAHRQIGELSGGQRKRAFVARAMAQGARLFLLDEPFAGVDKRSEAMMVQLFQDLAAEGAGVLVATHDLNSLSRLAREALLLRQTVLMHAPVEEVLRPDNLVRAFGMNVLG